MKKVIRILVVTLMLTVWGSIPVLADGANQCRFVIPSLAL